MNYMLGNNIELSSCPIAGDRTCNNKGLFTAIANFTNMITRKTHHQNAKPFSLDLFSHLQVGYSGPEKF